MTALESLLDLEYTSAVEQLSKKDSTLYDYIKQKLWMLSGFGHHESDKKLIECFDNETFTPEEDETFALNDLYSAYGILYGIDLFGIEFVKCYSARDRVMDPRYHFKKMVEKGEIEGKIGLAIMDYIEGTGFSADLVFRSYMEKSKIARLCYGLILWNGYFHIKRNKMAAMKVWEELPHTTYMDLSELRDEFNNDEQWGAKEFLEGLGFGLKYHGPYEEE